MAEKSISAKMCELVQGLDYITDFNKFTKVLKERKCILKWAYCIHDKDVNEDGSLKKKHVHVYMRFKDSNTFSFISSWFGVPENCINKIQAPRFEGALPYLIHANAPEKYQYDVSEVHANFDYKEFLEKWKKGQEKHHKSKSADLEALDDYVERICSGEIRKFNFTDYIDGVIYSKYKNRLDNAFKFREEKLKGVDRSMDCIYMCGGSGTGKTTLAKKIAKDMGYSVFISGSGKDPFDGYGGQDCVIMDDARPEDLARSVWYKVFDPNTSSSVASRYYNKTLECKLIIITTVLNIETFHKRMSETLGSDDSRDEPITQFKRRCKSYYTFTKDTVYIYEYDDESEEYISAGKFINPVKDMYPTQKMTVQKAQEKAKQFLKGVMIENALPEDLANAGFVPASKNEQQSISRAEKQELKYNDLDELINLRNLHQL